MLQPSFPGAFSLVGCRSRLQPSPECVIYILQPSPECDKHIVTNLRSIYRLDTYYIIFIDTVQCSVFFLDKSQNQLILYLRVPKIDFKKIAKKAGAFFEELIAAHGGIVSLSTSLFCLFGQSHSAFSLRCCSAARLQNDTRFVRSPPTTVLCCAALHRPSSRDYYSVLCCPFASFAWALRRWYRVPGWWGQANAVADPLDMTLFLDVNGERCANVPLLYSTPVSPLKGHTVIKKWCNAGSR